MENEPSSRVLFGYVFGWVLGFLALWQRLRQVFPRLKNWQVWIFSSMILLFLVLVSCAWPRASLGLIPFSHALEQSHPLVVAMLAVLANLVLAVALVLLLSLLRATTRQLRGSGFTLRRWSAGLCVPGEFVMPYLLGVLTPGHATGGWIPLHKIQHWLAGRSGFWLSRRKLMQLLADLEKETWVDLVRE